MLYSYAGAAGHREEQVWMSHGDSVTKLPPGFRTVAHSDQASNTFYQP